MVKRVTSKADNIMRYRGLSTDEKPEAENGAIFFEMDTGMYYDFDGNIGEWVKSKFTVGMLYE